MNQKWLNIQNPSLQGKTVVLTGATGGLGSQMCRYLLSYGAALILVTRNREKSENLCISLRQEYPGCQLSYLLADFEQMDQVITVCKALSSRPVDILMLNAGTYALPRQLSSCGYDNVFTTNFIAHYVMVKQLLPLLKARHGKVVATGSISYRFSPSDPQDVDFAHHEGANLIYGNSKRYLMFSLMELLRQEPEVDFAIGHPGISFTGITAHYPKAALLIVKPSMKLIFMHPGKACRSMVQAVFQSVPYMHWLGPGVRDIWGNPRLLALDSCDQQERMEIFRRAEKIYSEIL